MQASSRGVDTSAHESADLRRGSPPAAEGTTHA